LELVHICVMSAVKLYNYH